MSSVASTPPLKHQIRSNSTPSAKRYNPSTSSCHTSPAKKVKIALASKSAYPVCLTSTAAMTEEQGKKTKVDKKLNAYVFSLDEAYRKRDGKSSDGRTALRRRYFGTDNLSRGFFGQPDLDYEAEAEGTDESDSDGSGLEIPSKPKSGKL